MGPWLGQTAVHQTTGLPAVLRSFHISTSEINTTRTSPPRLCNKAELKVREDSVIQEGLETSGLCQGRDWKPGGARLPTRTASEERGGENPQHVCVSPVPGNTGVCGGGNAGGDRCAGDQNHTDYT